MLKFAAVFTIRQMVELMNFHWLFFFFFNDPATTEIYTLSLHDALPISEKTDARDKVTVASYPTREYLGLIFADRKSTRLNSSHPSISYAVFCLKKKNSPTGGWQPWTTLSTAVSCATGPPNVSAVVTSGQ